MIVYNITTKVHTSIDEAWLQWQLEEHIPEIMSAGFFNSYKILHLLEQDDADGHTYAIQYEMDDLYRYEEYMTICAPALQQKGFSKWGDKTISFRSVMEVIQ